MNIKHQLQEKIDNYLFGLLSEEERIAFEQEMKEDAKLCNEVEFTRLIMESFQMKREQEALKEMQNISSEAELRSILKEAEKKYHPVKTIPPTKKSNFHFYWGLAAGVAAGILLTLLLSFSNHSKQTKSSVELNIENQFLGDPTFVYANKVLIDGDSDQWKKVKLKLEDIRAKLTEMDSLQRSQISTTIPAVRSEPTLRFANQRRTGYDPAGFRVEWTSIYAQGDIYLYNTHESEIKKLALNYDLNKGFYQLKDLQSNTFYYFFIIKKDNKEKGLKKDYEENGRYLFVFRTK